MRYLILLGLLIQAVFSHGQNYINQKYDNQRFFFDVISRGCYNLDPDDTIYWLGTLFDFTGDTLRLSGVERVTEETEYIKYWTYTNAAQICHTDGKVGAYFNGYQLWDRYGDSTNLDVFRSFLPYPYSTIFGHNNSLILPMPDQEATYMLIGTNDYQYDPIYRTEAAEGLTSVVFKMDVNGIIKIKKTIPEFFHGKLTHQGAITACRHANGRDWWVVSPERFSKKINTFLLTPSGIAYQGDQVLSDTLLDFSFSPSFSPDGQWYARTHIVSISMWEKINHAQLIPFDRCSGTFGDPITFTIPYEDSSDIGSIIFSPNSRYFYVLCATSIWQGDLTAPDIPASLVRVARYNPTIIDNGVYSTFGIGFLGPDKNIYIFDGRNNFRSSVINSPDSLGLACDARYASLMKPSCTGMSLGNMPDFNLGPIDGSPCDTLGLDNPLATHTSGNTQSAPLEIYPNPSMGLFSVNVPSQNGFLSVIDMKGQHVRTLPVPRFKMVVDVSLPAGVYIITYYSDDGKIIARGKVAVMDH